MSEVLLPGRTRILSRNIKHRMRPVPVDEEERRGEPGAIYVLVDVNDSRAGICRPVFFSVWPVPKNFPRYSISASWLLSPTLAVVVAEI